MTTIGLIEKHDLYRNSFKLFLESLGEFHVIIDAKNGDLFMKKLASVAALPEIVITDFQMQKLEGKGIILLLKNHYPTIKTIVMTMYNHEHLISEIIISGAKGFLNKNINVDHFFTAINNVIAGNIVIVSDTDQIPIILEEQNYQLRLIISPLSDKQKNFLHICTNPRLTYKEIASILNISPKTADRYRDELFRKLHVNSRSGLLLYASQVGITSS